MLNLREKLLKLSLSDYYNEYYFEKDLDNYLPTLNTFIEEKEFLNRLSIVIKEKTIDEKYQGMFTQEEGEELFEKLLEILEKRIQINDNTLNYTSSFTNDSNQHKEGDVEFWITEFLKAATSDDLPMKDGYINKTALAKKIKRWAAKEYDKELTREYIRTRLSKREISYTITEMITAKKTTK